MCKLRLFVNYLDTINRGTCTSLEIFFEAIATLFEDKSGPLYRRITFYNTTG